MAITMDEVDVYRWMRMSIWMIIVMMSAEVFMVATREVIIRMLSQPVGLLLLSNALAYSRI